MRSNIKTIKHNVFLQLSQDYPELTLEQVDQVVDNYFIFFKKRLIEYDKLELRLLNLGTIVTKSRKLVRCIRLQEKIIQEESGQNPSSSTSNSNSSKTENALRNLERLKPLFETFSDIKQKGKTSRKKIRHVNQTQSDNSV